MEANSQVLETPKSLNRVGVKWLLLFSQLANSADGGLIYLNVLDHLANLIFLGAYWVKDILWLRLLCIVGSLVVIPFYLLRPELLWPPVMWSCVFITIHAIRAWGIVKERRPVAFTGDEQFIYDKTFSALSFQQFKLFLAIGEWQDLERGHVLHSTGDQPDSLEAVVRGERQYDSFSLAVPQ